MGFKKKYAAIVTTWNRMQVEGCDPAWNDYGAFREWSERRWAEGAALKKIFEELPWGPDNAYWDGGLDPDAWTITWSRQYRRTPAQKNNPCAHCRSADKCTMICPARARWWDTEATKWRRR